MTTVFLFGRYVVDNSQFAVIASFTAAAILAAIGRIQNGVADVDESPCVAVGRELR